MGFDVQNFDWSELPSRRELNRRLDKLDISADGKVALAQLVDKTTMVGDRTLEVGRRILAFAFECFRQFPYLTFCSVVALAITAVIGCVPLLGGLLGALIGPLLLAAGIGLGASYELQDGDMKGRFDALADEFKAIFA